MSSVGQLGASTILFAAGLLDVTLGVGRTDEDNPVRNGLPIPFRKPVC